MYGYLTLSFLLSLEKPLHSTIFAMVYIRDRNDNTNDGRNSFLYYYLFFSFGIIYRCDFLILGSRVAETSDGCQEETLTKQSASGSENTQTYSGRGDSRQGGNAVTSSQKLLASEKCSLSTSGTAIDTETKEEPFEVQDVSTSTGDTTTEEFVTVKEASPASSTVACVETKEELLVSKESQLKGEGSFINVDSQIAKSVESENYVPGLLPAGQGTEVSGSAEENVSGPTSEENAFGPTAESGGNEDLPNDFTEEDQDADTDSELGTGDEAVESDRPAAVVANEDKDSLQSNDVTNSDAQSFERISSYNEVTSLGESGQNEPGNNGQLPTDTGSTFPAFIIDAVSRPFNIENAGADDETVSSLSFGPVDSSKNVTPASEVEEEETDVTLNDGNHDTEEIQEIQESDYSMPSSFEPLSLALEGQRSVSFGPVSSSIEVIQSADFAGDQMSHTVSDLGSKTTSASVDHTSFSEGPQEKLGNLLESTEIIEASLNNAVMADAPETTAALLNSETYCCVSQDSTRADNSMTSIEVIQPPSLDVNGADTLDKLPFLKMVSSDAFSNVQETSVEGADNSRSSVEVIQKSASESDSADEIRSASADARSKMSSPSNESFQSLEQFDGSTTSGSRQDFFSLSNSPELGGETLLDSISSNDQREEKKRLGSQSDSTSFDMDLDFSTATESPPERTPTNTPTWEIAAENPADDVQQSLESSSDGVMDGKEQEPQNFDAKTPTTQLTQKPQWMLGIDKNKITEAIEKAQSHPDKMEIGQLQILVEMLKQEDMIMDVLDTAVQCIIRVSAFTTNVVS